MEILERGDHGYSQDPTKNFGFEKFDGQGSSDVLLIVAAFEQLAGCWDQYGLSGQELARIKSKKVVRLEFEETNKFFRGENFDSYDHSFHRVFTLCPYTADYLNNLQGEQRRIPVFFPFDREAIPAIRAKDIDIVYTGHIIAKPILRDIKVISNFNYRLVSNTKNKLVTDFGVGYQEKINLISRSKITLVHNLLYPTFQHLKEVWKYPSWQNNLAFKCLPQSSDWLQFFLNRKNMVVPQLKSRAFEAAFSRSLILCKRDPFNIIENFFDPGEEFVYFDDGELKDRIADILLNYEKYLPIIKRAHLKAVSLYTTEAFFNKYLKNI